jgi:hypothetical protein
MAMSTTYADLEHMYDGRIPAEELARCEDLRPNRAARLSRSQAVAELEALAEMARLFADRLDRLHERAPADILPRIEAAQFSFEDLGFIAAARAAAADIENAAE